MGQWTRTRRTRRGSITANIRALQRRLQVKIRWNFVHVVTVFRELLSIFTCAKVGTTRRNGCVGDDNRPVHWRCPKDKAQLSCVRSVSVSSDVARFAHPVWDVQLNRPVLAFTVPLLARKGYTRMTSGRKCFTCSVVSEGGPPIWFSVTISCMLTRELK